MNFHGMLYTSKPPKFYAQVLLSILVFMMGVEEISGQGILKVENFETSPVLIDQNGYEIPDITVWERHRPFLLSQFENLVYGKVEVENFRTSWTEEIVDSNLFGHGHVLKEITLIFEKDGVRVPLNILMALPKGDVPVNVFLGYNFHGNHTVIDHPGISITEAWVHNRKEWGIEDNRANENDRGKASSRWPIQQILDRGYGLVTMYYGEVDPDFDDDFNNGLHRMMKDAYENRQASTGGSISTWAWAISRVIDHLENMTAIDNDGIAVIGHSRLGKTALWAGAQDKRISLVISNNSGCGGAALSKRRHGETVKAINDRFPHWFCDQFKQFNDREGLLPIDQHMLISLIAPRAVYVASASDDDWADPRGEFLSVFHAGPAFELYGLQRIESSDMPAVNNPIVEGYIGYHIREGKHDLKLYDWQQFLNFADAYFRSSAK